ncbi:beta 1-4 rhamnosyltransferase Cps2T [Lactococcus termiticola]|uniref:Glycosyl transferase n=1 Tax=Lactococcus termiticola TaxID=2169526 RepID=A0A2R5HEQ2_9LACT|nr:DUF1972 domain-containing protein [Lactococcus termiticola]GBG96557.1 glycosyl transferase [Lactococcus termiticola]
MRDVFIIGSRGLPAQYGGFETFVENLVKNQKSKDIRYHVACLSHDKTEKGRHFDYEGADCFVVKPAKLGPASVMSYDARAIKQALKYIKEENIEAPIFYILGNTIGGFIKKYIRKIHKVGGLVFVNPDGLEWRRTKWSGPVRAYLKYAEKKMVQHADLIVSDNQGIADYLTAEYGEVKTRVIAYGTEQMSSRLTSSPTLDKFEVSDYFLIVGRFVPENNYEMLVRSFVTSQLKQDLVIVTNYEGNPFYEELDRLTGFKADPRIKFVGTVYDQEELRFIREHAVAYLHGHEVGGTNPGLLEALWSTPVSLVLDCDFNRKTAEDAVLYFNIQNLPDKLSALPGLSDYDRKIYQEKARQLVQTKYTWDAICQEYEVLFLES